MFVKKSPRLSPFRFRLWTIVNSQKMVPSSAASRDSDVVQHIPYINKSLFPKGNFYDELTNIKASGNLWFPFLLDKLQILHPVADLMKIFCNAVISG